MDPIEKAKNEGNVLFKEGRFDDAKNKYTEAISSWYALAAQVNVPSQLVTLLINRAACHLKMKDYQLCIVDCNNALSLDPSCTKALYRRACALENVNEFQESFKDALLVSKIEPNNRDAISLLRRIKEKMGKFNNGGPMELLLKQLRDSQQLEDSSDFKSTLQKISSLLADDFYYCSLFSEQQGMPMLCYSLKQYMHDISVQQMIWQTLLTLFQHERIVKQYVVWEPVASDTLTLTFGGKLLFKPLIEFSKELETDSHLQTSVVMVIMAMLSKTDLFRGHQPTGESLSKDHLFLSDEIMESISSCFCNIIRQCNSDVLRTVCDAVVALASEHANFLTASSDTAVSNETVEHRKSRIISMGAVRLRSSIFISKLFEAGIVPLLVNKLVGGSHDEQQISSSCLSRLVHQTEPSFAREQLREYWEGEINIASSRKQMLLARCFLQTSPEIGEAVLMGGKGFEKLITILQSNSLDDLRLACDVLCLAAGNDRTIEILQPLVANGILENLSHHSDQFVQVASASTITKLSIKSKALRQDSSDCGSILSSAFGVIRKSVVQQIDIATLERALEIIASLVGSSMIKNELVFGSSRVNSIVKELCSIAVDDRSTICYGLAHILCGLTVTNREIRAQVLAEKDMTVEQYEKMMQLQKLNDPSATEDKSKDEEADNDTADVCKSRIRIIVQSGGIKLLLQLSKLTSEQTSQMALKALRQICVDESSRGLFVQHGGLKLCLEQAGNAGKSKISRLEAAHAVAKCLVTTNPTLLDESLRLQALRCLLQLCKESDANDLQRFEALLSITNLLSCGATEQDRLVAESGIPIMHYLIFSSNLMVRCAATEALCNLSVHPAMTEFFFQPDHVRLFLGLIEEWISSPSDTTSLNTAKAATACLCMTGGDSRVCKLIIQEKGLETFCSALHSKQRDMTHRIITLFVEMVTSLKSSSEKEDFFSALGVETYEILKQLINDPNYGQQASLLLAQWKVE